MATILDYWELTAEELTSIIDHNPSIRGMLFGYVAEFQLRKHLESTPGISDMYKEDDHDRSNTNDLIVTYRGRQFSLESKSLQTNSIRRQGDILTGSVQCDKSDNTVVELPNGDRLQTTCLLCGGFDILAVNLFQFVERWQFVFALNHNLPRTTYRRYTPEQQQYLLKSLIPVQWPLRPKGIFTTDITQLLDYLIETGGGCLS